MKKNFEFRNWWNFCILVIFRFFVWKILKSDPTNQLIMLFRNGLYYKQWDLVHHSKHIHNELQVAWLVKRTHVVVFAKNVEILPELGPQKSSVAKNATNATKNATCCISSGHKFFSWQLSFWTSFHISNRFRFKGKSRKMLFQNEKKFWVLELMRIFYTSIFATFSNKCAP